MTRFIEPAYDSFDVVTSWDEGGQRWAKELAVHIVDKSGAVDQGVVGEDFYVIVCSPTFLKEPNGEVTGDDLKRAIVMEDFSEQEVETRLKNKIDIIGRVNLAEFEERFEAHFDMTDWYSE